MKERKYVLLSLLFVSMFFGCSTGINDPYNEVVDGFGSITRKSNKLTSSDLLSASCMEIEYDIDFGINPYDDVADYPYLTDGAKQLFDDDNTGSSSIYSKIFSYEILNRGEYAELLKTREEIEYNDLGGKKADYLIEIENTKIGISVTRAYHFPPTDPYTAGEAISLLTNKLSDIETSSLNVKDIDKWIKQILVIAGYNEQYSETVITEWLALDDVTKGNTILCIVTTNGDDSFIYWIFIKKYI